MTSIATLALAPFLFTAATLTVTAEDWPQFRGPGATGVRDGAKLPTTFDKPTWRTEISGLSHSSPVISGGRVFVATAIPQGDEATLKVGLYGAGDSAEDLVETEFRLIALDAESGEVLWDVLAIKATPPFGRHTKATQVNSTPAVSGDSVVAIFGSHGLFCFDVKSGERRWHAELGPLDCGPWNATDLEWGFASSPIIARDRVIVQADVKTDPFLAAFELDSGKEAWRVERDDVNGWSTPTAVTLESGEVHVVVNGCKHMGAYALATGKEVWRLAGGGGIPVPTPVEADGLIYFTSNHRPLEPSHPLKPVFAVKTSAKGDLGVAPADPADLATSKAAEDLAWMTTRRGNYMQTPIVYRGHVWLCYDSGMLTCFDAATGVERYRERIQEAREGFSASGVAGDGRLYFTSEEGRAVIVAAGPEFKVLGRADLGEICMATPAITGDALVFRLRHSVARYD